MITYRKDLDRPLTSDEVDGNFLTIVENHGAEKLASRSIIINEEHQQFSSVKVFALPVLDIPEYNYDFHIVLTKHKYSSISRDNVRFHTDVESIDVHVGNDGTVSPTPTASFSFDFDSVNRILYFITNDDVSGVKSIDWFLSITGFSAVFSDDFDKTINYY